MINDDELPRGQRGMRGMRGGRGGPGGRGRGGLNMGPMMDREYVGPRFDPMYRDRNYGGGQQFMPPRPNDDFFVRPQRGGRGGRRGGGPPDMYPRMQNFNFGGPPRGYDDHYYEHFDNYGGGMYPPRNGGYNAPGPYRRDMPPQGGPRFRPDFDGR